MSSKDNSVSGVDPLSAKEDMEKGHHTTVSSEVLIVEGETNVINKLSFWRKLASYGVEIRGVQPVPAEKRTDTRYLNVFTLFSTSMCCLLPLTTGIVGTLSFGMSLKDSFLVIFFIGILTCIPPAYIITISPRTGMRQMIQARYSFGYYPNILPVVLNMASIMGFTMISTVVGGQTLVALSNDTLSVQSGIVIIALISMFVSIAGYKIMHAYLRYAWIPALIAIIICVGVRGKHLKEHAPTEAPEASTVISFASIIAGYMIPFVSTCGDYAVYMPPTTPKLRLFFYCLSGVCLPSLLLMTLGAAIGATVPVVPEWADANDADSIGGVMSAMLKPAGGFGKFVTLIIALSVISNTAPSIYSVSLNFQILIPKQEKIPRILYVIIATGILIGVAIGAAEDFMRSLESFLFIIAYWSAAFCGVYLTEWIWFRKRNAQTMDPGMWNKPKELPSGFAALGGLIIPFAFVIPSMDQVWYVGPIAKVTGDLGFEFAFITSIPIYILLRTIEIKYFRNGRL